MGRAGGIFKVAIPAVQYYRAMITTYPGGGVHPHSYQGRVLTRDSENYYYAVRNGSTLEIRKKPHASASWSLAGSFACIGTNQGDVASIAMDSTEKLHAVYYVTGINIGYRYSTDRGATWSSETIIATDVTWNSATCSSAALAIDASDNLLVVFSDEAGTKPYFTRYSGSWSSPVRIADISHSLLRPTVIAAISGRLFAAFTGTSDKGTVYYSDDNGATWTAGSPTTTGYTNLFNIRLTGYGNLINITGQDSSGSRSIIRNYCTAGSLDWLGTWEVIENTTGADGNLSFDSAGFPHLISRQYDTGTFVVYHYSKVTGSWVRETISESVNHILPTAFWQEFARFSPRENRLLAILPESAGTIYSQLVSGVILG